LPGFANSNHLPANEEVLPIKSKNIITQQNTEVISISPFPREVKNSNNSEIEVKSVIEKKIDEEY
jgi:hypothetical protein